jgi:biofilm PGA synthesis lipoprotein PgaB
MRWLQSLGVRHLGYYPDDFIGNQPRLDDLRQGISLADGYGEVMP